MPRNEAHAAEGPCAGAVFAAGLTPTHLFKEPSSPAATRNDEIILKGEGLESVRNDNRRGGGI